MAAMDNELEFQRLIDELSDLIQERDAALSSLSQVNEHLAALSTAIGLTSSGLNTPTGLLCMLRLVSHLGDVFGSSKSPSNFLFELTLRNDSILSMNGNNWNIIVARLKPQENSVVHVASLPHIASGSAWTGTMALEISPSLIKDSVDLAVFLYFTGTDSVKNSVNNDSFLYKSSNIALLHVFRLDSLDALQACNAIGGGGGGSNFNSVTAKSYGTSSQVMRIKVGVPKQFFGLEPEPQNVLDVLVKQGERSLPLPLTTQISNEMKKINSEMGGSSGSNIHSSSGMNNIGGIGQRRQQKATVQGELPLDYNLSTNATSASAAALVNIQPAPFSLAASSSPHAVLDLTCEAGNLINSLRLHKAALRRIQLLETAVQKSGGGGADGGGGIQLSHGVVVPPACSFGAIIDSIEMDEMTSKVNSLKEAAVQLRKMVVALEARGEPDADDEENRAAELLELVTNTRNLTKDLVITL